MHLASFVGELIVSALVGYIALTGALAERIEVFFTGEQQRETAAVGQSHDERTQTRVAAVPSEYEYGGPIPDILLRHTPYQEAAVGASVPSSTPGIRPGATTSLNARITDALVNIYCSYRTDEYHKRTTGTGFFISDRGVILTNAHIAHMLLFEDVEGITDPSCVIRTGAPAEPTYTADLLYLPPSWINDNAEVLDDPKPRGTGERDYALLYVTDTVDDSPLPARYPALSFDTALLPRSTAGTEIFAAGYPADEIVDEGAEIPLSPIVATTTVGELYTFGSNYADIFSIDESAVGENGASGGPIIDETGEVIGLIATKGNIETEGPRSLRAITLSYIDRTIKLETGFTLAESLGGDLAYRGRVFADALGPFLTSVIGRQFE